MDASPFNGRYSALELCLREALSVIQPSEDDVTTRFLVINELKTVVDSVESLRGATVEPFGSFVSKLYSRWGDLDISVEVPCGSFIPSVGKRQKQNVLRDIRKALQRRGVARCVQFIPNARVPLLMFESNYRNISCDISVNNLLGVIKSKFLFWISEINERFRDMVLLVKEWAKSQNINNPKEGTLNSYSLSMLVIFHFQTCEPAILPPLQELYPGNIVDDLTGVRVSAERSIEDICTANIRKFRARSYRNVNRRSLAELFISFFQKFSGLNRMALRHAICPYTGKWEPIASNYRWMAKTYPLLIEDPFERPENAARTVSSNELMRISEAFEETHSKLSRNQDQRSMIATLVRHQHRSRFYARTQGNQSADAEGIRRYTQRPTQDRVRSISGHPFLNAGSQRFSNRPSEGSSSSSGVSQLENQFEDMDLDGYSHQNTFSQRLGQTVGRQGRGQDARR